MDKIIEELLFAVRKACYDEIEMVMNQSMEAGDVDETGKWIAGNRDENNLAIDKIHAKYGKLSQAILEEMH